MGIQTMNLSGSRRKESYRSWNGEVGNEKKSKMGKKEVGSGNAEVGKTEVEKVRGILMQMWERIEFGRWYIFNCK